MELYLFLFLCVVPCFWAGAANGTHDYLAILVSSFVWVYWIFAGVPFYLPLAVLMIWLVGTVFWSTHMGNSIFDALMVMAVFTVALAAPETGMFVPMFLAFLPAPGMAALEIYQWHMKHTPPRRGALYGNTNHAGIYYAINFFIGCWLTLNISFVFAPFSIILLVSLFLTRCRAAILGLCAGMGIILCYLFPAPYPFLVMVAVGVFLVVTQRPIHHMKMAFDSRGLCYLKTLRLIRERPIFGWGLNTFKREHQFQPPVMSTHRVHNDPLELTFESGIIGLVLFAGLFYTLSWNDPFIAAGIVCGIVTSLFFFTLREAHTAGPLMVLVGLSIPPVDTVALPLLLSVVLALALVRIIGEHVLKRIMGLFWYAKGSYESNFERQRRCVERAIAWHPYSEYLSRLSFLTQKVDPTACFEASARMVFNYEGRVVLWAAYDQLSRAAFRLGAVQLAAFFNKKSLEVHPKFLPATRMKKELDRLFQYLKEKPHGVVEMR